MNARRVIAAFAVVLFVAALAAAWFATGEHDARIGRVASLPGPGVETRAARRQDFALPEVAVAELAREYPPFVFVVRVTPPGAEPRTDVVEPAATGRALLPPVAPGSELSVAVIAGGSRYGCTWEEAVGTGSARAPEGGGRFHVVVPVRVPSATSTPLRLFVTDDQGWPLAGARVTDAAGAWSATTSEAGYCVAGSAADRIRVQPPESRPDLAAFDGGPGRWDYVAAVALPRRVTADASLPPASDASVPPDLARIDLQPCDGRPFLQRVTLAPGRVISSVPLGSYDTRWLADGRWHRATLEVAADASRFVPSSAAVRATRVEAPGTWQGFAHTLSAALLLMERSRASCLLPRSIVESGSYELTGGRGYTSRFTVADILEDGTAVFDGVAPGDYEIVSMSDPYFVSTCVRIDGHSDVVQVDCAPRVQSARIEGRVLGPPGARFDVQLRVLGRVFEVSRSVKCPEAYEFGDLAGGLYSIRALSAGAFRSGRSDSLAEVTPWRNVVVDPGGRVTVDFEIE